MRIVVRQYWWLQVLRITIGCAVIALGVLTCFLGAYAGLEQNQWQAFPAFFTGGLLFVATGFYFATYARLEWRPRGFVVAVTRRGLILKVNGIRCPKLVAIKWSQIQGAKYEPPDSFAFWPKPMKVFLREHCSFAFWTGMVKVLLHEPLPEGTLPAHEVGVTACGPSTVGLNGFWEKWHPVDVADLVNNAAKDPTFCETL